MGLTTTIDNAETALLALLLADGTLAAAKGPPRLGQPQKPMPEHIWIGDQVDEERDQELTGTGGLHAEQRFDLFVHVLVIQTKTPTDVYAALRNRVHALSEAVETVVAANPSLSGTVFDAVVSGASRDGGPGDQARGLEMTLRVACRALLA